MRRLALIALLAGSACVDAGADSVDVPLQIRGSDAATTQAGDWTVSLSQARLAFGPLNLCAGAQAGALCETARGEWLDSVVVDALDSTPLDVGSIAGSEGQVSSFMYDLGLVSLLTQDELFPMPAADELGGSVLIEGEAVKEGRVLPFVALLEVGQSDETEKGVPVVRSGTADVLDVDLGEVSGLTISFDARPWVEEIRFDLFVESEECSADKPVSCVDEVELRCLEDGQVQGTDCSLAGQVCQAGVGCVDRILIEPGSQAQRAIVNQLVAGPRPSFTFSN